MNLTDRAEIQLLKKVAIDRRRQIKELNNQLSNLRARRNFASEIIAEIEMASDNEDIKELARWVIDVLDNGFDELDEDFKEFPEPKGFEEEDLFKYKKVE
jgi:hypothetical protein